VIARGASPRPDDSAPLALVAAAARPTIGAMKNLFRIAVSSCALLLAAGCASHKTTAAPAVGLLNSTCAISGETLDASSPTADFMGGKVGFCCNNCVKKWNAMDDAGKKAAVDAHK